ncbi:hypothetical protein HPB47_003839 [Ixodes persulcatus]|uniref:Uncharacterized protein n=1 Tax=Ixodes persulcatus TaxID=34615 RepID=A0AC60PIB9_IXOPE|nr:hypothetical protein HPB47_003839 [Ixodes persulcatus]
MVMTDNSSAEKAVVQETGPTARQLLCHFHVAQAEWHWLTAAYNHVDKDQRCQLISLFQEASFVRGVLAQHGLCQQGDISF